MRFLTPGWLLLSLLSLPILLLYMLKLRRREVKVSSTMLWQALLRDRQANTPWQKLRRNLLLILQLLILAALTFALARPGIQVPVIASGSIVVLLDSSASMAAIDVSPNRFATALNAIRNLIDNLERTSKMTIIQVARQPKILIAGESDHEAIRQALLTATLTAEEANWQTAFTLAASAASAVEDEKTTIVIVSDGGIPNQDLPPLPGEVRYLPIGGSPLNLAISALAIRPAGLRNELFTSVTNYGDQEQSAILSIYLEDQLISAQQIQIPAGEQAKVNLSDFPTEDGIVKAALSPVNDGITDDWDKLELDNTAFAINRITTNRRILLVTPGNFFLEQLLGAFPTLQAFRAVRDVENSTGDGIRFHLPEEKFDLYVLDEALPTTGGLGIPELPEGNLLLINPPSNPLFPVTGVFTPDSEFTIKDHLLTKNLDWSTIHIRQARKIQTPVWAEVLVNSPSGPLVLAGETGGRRVVILAFDLNDSDLPLQVAFPILFANLMDYLAPSTGVSSDQNTSPGAGIDIQVPPGSGTIAIASPNGRIFTLSPTDSGFFFPYTNELGVYAINYIDQNINADYFAVNLFSPLESSIHPAEQIQVGRITVEARTQGALGLKELWFWIMMIGMAVLVFEWWVYHRRLVMPDFTWVRRLYTNYLGNRK